MTDSTEKKITSLLDSRKTTKARVLMSEEQLFDMWNKENKKFKSKSEMILDLIDRGYDQASVAHTLETFGILSSKSSRQHVRNTVEHRKNK